MKFTVNYNEVTGPRVRTEVWQNSTLRYSPPPDFPAYLAAQTGRARLMRCWITLDEYWDYRTGKFYPDYDIGVKRYPDEELHYPYDWKNIVPAPSGTRFVDYLTSHAQAAEEVMLNVRRLERETLDGVIGFDVYEKIFGDAVAYCKTLAPNIRYIECCNEVELRSFGALNMDEYYSLYRCACRAVAKLNRENHYAVPLELGGFAKAGLVGQMELWEGFLERYAADDLPEKRLDFYSLHHYDLDCTASLKKRGILPELVDKDPMTRYAYFLERHNAALKRLGLPQKPIFIDEMGFTRTTGVLTDSLKNASGTLWQLLWAAGKEREQLYLFPWCTFHNPKLQISFTQFLLLPDGSYAPTPNGNAIIMLHSMEDFSLAGCVCGADENTAAACRSDDGRHLTVVMTNPQDAVDGFVAEIDGLPADCTGVCVREYLVDSYRNNRVTGEPARDLHVTNEYEAVPQDGKITLRCTAEPYAFAFWDIVADIPGAPAVHKMKLRKKPFDAIASGRKTVEMRLYDEKRIAVRVGDEIVFTEEGNGRKMRCRVTSLDRCKTFDELFSRRKKEELGYAPDEAAAPDDLLCYYTRERIGRFGAVGIGVEVIGND